jgi:ABC-type multidrug transport system ATPase subunit
VLNWEDVLSLGEQQRIGMARLFYHKPLVAILDECTSALNVELEQKFYNQLKALGITYLSVGHRPGNLNEYILSLCSLINEGLQEYHDQLLQLKADKTWSISRINKEKNKQSSSIPSNMRRVRKTFRSAEWNQALLQGIDEDEVKTNPELSDLQVAEAQKKAKNQTINKAFFRFERFQK